MGPSHLPRSADGRPPCASPSARGPGRGPRRHKVGSAPGAGRREPVRRVSPLRALFLLVWLALAVAIQPLQAWGTVEKAPPDVGDPARGSGGPAEVIPPWRLTVLPRLGLLLPAPELYSIYKNFVGDGPIEWTSGSLGRALVVGLALEAQFPDGGVALRGEAARTFRGWFHATHGVRIPRILWDPPRVENTFFDIPAHLTFAGIQAVLPLRLGMEGLQPYVLLGFSGKWYDFGPPSPDNTVEAILPTEGFVPSADLGAGLAVGLWGFSLEFQVRDNVNRYWGRTQHDLVLSAAWTQPLTRLR